MDNFFFNRQAHGVYVFKIFYMVFCRCKVYLVFAEYNIHLEQVQYVGISSRFGPVPCHDVSEYAVRSKLRTGDISVCRIIGATDFGWVI